MGRSSQKEREFIFLCQNDASHLNSGSHTRKKKINKKEVNPCKRLLVAVCPSWLAPSFGLLLKGRTGGVQQQEVGLPHPSTVEHRLTRISDARQQVSQQLRQCQTSALLPREYLAQRCG